MRRTVARLLGAMAVASVVATFCVQRQAAAPVESRWRTTSTPTCAAAIAVNTADFNNDGKLD